MIEGQPSTNQSSPTTTIEPTSTEIIDPAWFDPEVTLGAMAGVAQGMTMVANHFTLNSYTGWLDDLTGSDINGAVDRWVEDGGWYYSTANQSARVEAHALHAIAALNVWQAIGGGEFGFAFKEGASNLGRIPLPHVTFAYGSSGNLTWAHGLGATYYVTTAGAGPGNYWLTMTGIPISAPARIGEWVARKPYCTSCVHSAAEALFIGIFGMR